jgi:AraC family transcriptional regulator
VTTIDSEHAPTMTQSAAPNCEPASDIRSHRHKRRRKQLRASRAATPHASTLEPSSRYLPMATAQLIEAACRARDGDSHGARVYVTRAIALLEGHAVPKIAKQAGDRNSRQIPRGGFAAWQRLAAHVDANLASKIVIKELAASLDISVGHFCRAFKCTFGMPARIWIRQRRIEYAQGLMLTTRASLSEIALSCGMSDQSHFTRSFRRIVGEVPSSWRQTRHGAIEERLTEFAYPAQRSGSRSCATSIGETESGQRRMLSRNSCGAVNARTSRPTVLTRSSSAKRIDGSSSMTKTTARSSTILRLP